MRCSRQIRAGIAPQHLATKYDHGLFVHGRVKVIHHSLADTNNGSCPPRLSAALSDSSNRARSSQNFLFQQLLITFRRGPEPHLLRWISTVSKVCGRSCTWHRDRKLLRRRMSHGCCSVLPKSKHCTITLISTQVIESTDQLTPDSFAIIPGVGTLEPEEWRDDTGQSWLNALAASSVPGMGVFVLPHNISSSDTALWQALIDLGNQSLKNLLWLIEREKVSVNHPWEEWAGLC